MKKTKITALAVSLFAAALSLESIAQQGFGTNSPAPSSVIDMTSNNKGVLLPRVALTSTTDVLTIPSPANSLMVFNTATAGLIPTNIYPGYYYWNATLNSWIRLIDTKNNYYNGLSIDVLNNVGLGGTLNHNSTIFYNDKSLTFWDGIEGNGFASSHSTVLDKGGIKLRYNDGGGAPHPSVRDYYLSIENTRTVNDTNMQLGTPFDGITTGIKSIFSIGNANNEQYIGGQFGSNVDNATGVNTVQIGVLGKVGYNISHNQANQVIGGYFQSNNTSTTSLSNYALYAKATGANPYALYADGGSVLIKDLDNTATPVLIGTRPIYADATGKLVVGSVSNSGWGLTGNAGTTVGTNFLGTTDAQDLVFKTNSTENFRINQKGRLITSGNFPSAGANSLYIGTAGNDTQLAAAVMNTAIGHQTMNTLTEGRENTAIGNQALNLLTDGIGNTAIGVQSLNNAVSTLLNTGVGYQSLYKVTGDGNTAIGANAGYNATNALTKDNNTFLGNGATYANSGATTITKSTAVGAGVVLTHPNTVILGTTTEKVGVGLSNPLNALHVKATADPLKLEGLQTGNAGDMMLTVGNDGVVKQQAYPGLLVSKFVSASYTVAANDYLIIVTQPTPAVAMTVTLPRADLNYGRIINISNFANAGTSPVTIRSFNGTATQLKTGTSGAVATALLEPADGTVASGKGKSTWISDGALWYIIGN